MMMGSWLHDVLAATAFVAVAVAAVVFFLVLVQLLVIVIMLQQLIQLLLVLQPCMCCCELSFHHLEWQWIEWYIF
jgi:hypothetical protein